MKTFNLASVRQCRLLLVQALVIGLLVSIVPIHVHAQGRDSRFRDFSQDFVPSPTELLRALSQLKGVQLKQPLSDQLRQFKDDFFRDLPPESQRELLEIGKDYMERIQNGENPELEEGIADFVQQQIRDNELQHDLSQLLEGFEGLPVPQGGERPPLPGNRSQPDSAAKQNRNRPDGRARPSESPAEPGVDRSWMPNPGELVEGLDAESIGRQLLERINESANGSADHSIDPGVFESLPQGNGPAFSDSGEKIGVRFDRMIMDVVKNRMNDSADSRSRFGESFHSMFEGLSDHVHTHLNNRDWSSQSGSSINSPFRNRGNGIGAGGGNWFSRLRGGPGSIEMTGQISWWILGGMAIVFFGLLTWIGMRVVSRQPAGTEAGLSRRRFRMPKIGTAEELVRAVDGYLLATFGRPSSWWHSRRAETALNSEYPARASSISDLVDCYEYARYSEVGGSLTGDQIQRCTNILRELVDHRTSVNTAVAGGES